MHFVLSRVHPLLTLKPPAKHIHWPVSTTHCRYARVEAAQSPARIRQENWRSQFAPMHMVSTFWQYALHSGDIVMSEPPAPPALPPPPPAPAWTRHGPEPFNSNRRFVDQERLRAGRTTCQAAERASLG